MGMARSEKRRTRRMDAARTSASNGIVKAKERVRRDARMVEKVKSGSLPYSPAVMSWLSRKLDVLLRAHLLGILGFDAEAQAKLYQANRNYQHLCTVKPEGR